MAQRNLRLSDAVAMQVAAAAKRNHYSSSSAFIRAAIDLKLGNRENDLTEAENRISSTLETVLRRLNRLEMVLQAQFALTDALAQILLFYTPEPPEDIREQIRLEAKSRHKKMLQMAAINMQGESGFVLEGLVKRAG